MANNPQSNETQRTQSSSSFSISSLVTNDSRLVIYSKFNIESPRNEGFVLPSINELMKPLIDKRTMNTPPLVAPFQPRTPILPISPLQHRVLQSNTSTSNVSINPQSSLNNNTSINNPIFINLTNNTTNHIQSAPFSIHFPQPKDFVSTSPSRVVTTVPTPAPSSSMPQFIVPQPIEKKRKLSGSFSPFTIFLKEKKDVGSAPAPLANFNEAQVSTVKNNITDMKSPQKRKEAPSEEQGKKKEISEEELKQKEDTFQHLLHTSLQGPFVFNDSSCENLLDAYNQFHKNDSSRLLPPLPSQKRK